MPPLSQAISPPTDNQSSDMKQTCIPLFFFAILALCFLSGCGSRDSQPSGMGPLSDFLFEGAVDGWSGSTVDNVYWLENQASDPNDIRYFYTAANKSAFGKRTAEVEIFTEHMDPESRAGLLYGFQESTRSYYLIVAGCNGSIDMYLKDNDGFQLSQSSSVGAKPNKPIRIQIKEDGQQLTILANGKTLSSIGNNSIGKGQLGIAAFGSGKFGFTNYQETPSSDTPKRKDIIPLAAKRASYPLSDCVYFGDASWDIKASHELEIPLIGIGRKPHLFTKQNRKPHFRDFKEVEPIVKALKRFG
ncbi:hypothetical protein MLD52_07130 [Puniceicoccaceae bacterium K14]|nr:hypothetical protein [Puniceicoccaceae bacterium K14]